MLDGIQESYLLESNGFTVEVAVSEKYDIVSNTSAVTVGLWVKSAGKLGVQYFSGSIKIDGQTLLVMDSTISTHNIHFDSYNTWYKVVRSSDSYSDSPWTMENIVHNSEGAKNITLELEMRSYGLDDYLGLRVATTKTIALTQIPRASTAAATDANIGAVSTISIIRRVSSYTHSVAYQFGSLSGYLRADGTTSTSEVKLTVTGIPFRLPESFYGQIPNAPAGDCTLTVRTYWGNEQIGSAQTTAFTVTADKKLCLPRISGTVEDTNAAAIALTGDKNVLVRYVSNARCTISANAKNSATIAAKTIGGVAVTGDSLTMEGMQTDTVLFTCRDSRGYEASAEVKKPMVLYVPLSASVSAARTDPTSGNVKLVVSGICFNGSFGAVRNGLSVSCTVNNQNTVAVEPVFEDNAYTAQTVLSGLDYQGSYTISVTVADQLQTVTKSVKIGKGIPVFDWDEDDFQFHVPVSLSGKHLTDLADPEKDADAVNARTMNTALSGKAPAGYGLGTIQPTTVSSKEQLDACRTCGFYRYAVFGTTLCGIYFNFATLIVYPIWTDECVQELRPLNTNYCFRRFLFGSVWSAGELVGQVQTKLWENTSLTGNFPAQTIALDLSGYDHVYVEAIRSTDDNRISGHTRLRVGGLSGYLMGSTDQFSLTRREVSATKTGVTFSGFYSANTSNGASNEIPYRIYGIKGIAEVEDTTNKYAAICGEILCGETVCG